MADVLLINASPRGPESESARIAEQVLAGARGAAPELELDRLDLFEEDLPAFGADAALAKMDVVAGRAVAAERVEAWEGALATAHRLAETPLWILAVPMWNSGVPWTLKRLIDTVTQPGVAFSFDPEAGYAGLFGGRRAVAVYTSQVYAPGVPAAFGADYHASYIRWWLDFLAVELIGEVRLQPTYADGTLDRRRSVALERARRLGIELAGSRRPVLR